MNVCYIRGIAILAVFGPVCAAIARVEPGAFINRPAASISQLVQQVETDPEVAGRFMQHYGMTRQEIIAFFRTLRPSKLAASGRYTVYNSHDNGITAKVLTLKKGTLLWVERGGAPALRARCANPMGTGPRTIIENPEAKIEAIKVPRGILRDAASTSEGEAVETTALASEPAFTLPTLEPVVDAMPPMLSPPEPLPPIGGASNDWLPALLLPFLIRPPGGDAIVPEPATFLVLAAGVYPLIRSKMRRKNQGPRA